MWSATILGISVAVLIGVAFVGGCFCGSWIQRTISYVIRTRLDKELLDSASEREEENFKRRRAVDWQASRTTNAEEALANVHRVPVENPLGPGLPSPDELDELLDANPHDFTKNLGTERMKRAMDNG